MPYTYVPSLLFGDRSVHLSTPCLVTFNTGHLSCTGVAY